MFKASSSHPSLLHNLNFTPDFSTFSPTSSTQGMRVVVSSRHAVSATLPQQREDSSYSPLLQCRVLLTEDSPSPTSSTWILPIGYSSSQTLLVLAPSMRYSTSETFCSVMDPPRGSQVLSANLLPCGLLFPRVHRSCQEPGPVWASHRVTAFSGNPWAVRGSLLCYGPPWAAAGQLPHHGLHLRLQRNLCSSLKHLLPLLHWPGCLQSSCCPIFLVSFFLQLFHCSFFPLLSCAIPDALVSSGSTLGLAGISTVEHWGASGSISQQPTP